MNTKLLFPLIFLAAGLSGAIFLAGYKKEVSLEAYSPVAESPSPNSFQQKCSRPGVINCFDFDHTSRLRYTWMTGSACEESFKQQTNYELGRNRLGQGNTTAVVQNGQCVFPVIDTTIIHSGEGSLRISIPSNSSADSGGYFSEVFRRDLQGKPDGTYIGPGSPFGSVFYFQFYQRFDKEFLSTDFRCLGGECGGWKQAIWYGNPPNGMSAGDLEVTLNNAWQRGVPQMYGQRGADDYGVEDAHGCPYNRGVNGAGSGFESRINYTEPHCVVYKPDLWMEFTGRIEISGAANQPASRVQLWVDGKLVIDYARAKIDWSGSLGKGFGQFLLTPYHTNKDSSQAHPNGHTWYDDLIISTQPIAMKPIAD